MRLARAWRAAPQALTSVDKANVLESSRLWREVATEVGAKPDVALEHLLVDSAAMRLIAARATSTSSSPRTCSATSSPTRRPCSPARSGCCPRPRSARDARGLYEPIHGSAPDIAGTGIANPFGAS